MSVQAEVIRDAAATPLQAVHAVRDAAIAPTARAILRTVIGKAEAALREAFTINFSLLSVADLQQLVRSTALTRDRLEALAAGALAELSRRRQEAQSRADAGKRPDPAVKGPARSPQEVLVGAGQSTREARAAVRRAVQVTDTLPLFAAAWRAGEISQAYVDVMRRLICTHPEVCDRLEAGAEAELLAFAHQADSVDQFSKRVRWWLIKYFPRHMEQQIQREITRENINLFPLSEQAGWKISGTLSALHGHILNVALDHTMGRKAAEDHRRINERRAEALMKLAEDRAGTTTNGRPRIGTQILVTVPVTALAQAEHLAGSGCLVDATDQSAEARNGTGAGDHHCSGPMRAEGVKETERAKGIGKARGAERVTGAENVAGASRHATNCSVVGTGLGRQGACMAEVKRDRDVLQGALGKMGADGKARDMLGEMTGLIRGGPPADVMAGITPATLSDGTALSPMQFRKLLCESTLARVVLSAKGEVLDVGRRARLFTPAQVRGVVARDRTCRYPGCTESVEHCEVHHAIQWEKGGRTDIDNAMLLCWHHHAYVHAQRITIAHHQGGFMFTLPNGKEVGYKLNQRE